MIQRVQSVYLVLVKIFAVLFLFVPIGNVILTNEPINISIAENNLSEISAASLGGEWLRYFVIALAIIIMILTLITIFVYKKRLKQIKLNQINLILHILMIALTFFYIDIIRSHISSEGLEIGFRYGLAILLPLISLILILMATKAIRKDENIVRSADRLR